jgi:hypothetical protein
MTDALWPCYDETQADEFFHHARRLERERAAATADKAALIAALEALRGAGEVHMTYHPSDGALFLKSNADFYKSLDQARATLAQVRG